MLPSNCTQKVNGKALLLDQAFELSQSSMEKTTVNRGEKARGLLDLLVFSMHARNRGCCSRDSQRQGFSVHGLLLCKFKETEPKHKLCQKENIIAPVISTQNYPTNRLSLSKGKHQFTATQALIV